MRITSPSRRTKTPGDVRRRQGLQEAVVRIDRHAPLPLHRGGDGLRPLVAALLFRAGLGQLRGDAPQLVLGRRQLVLGDLRLLPGLGQQRVLLLVVAVQRVGPVLELLVLPGEHRLLLLGLAELPLQHHRIVGTQPARATNTHVHNQGIRAEIVAQASCLCRQNDRLEACPTTADMAAS